MTPDPTDANREVPPPMHTLEIDINTDAGTAHVVSTGDTVVIGEHDTIYNAVGNYAVDVARELAREIPVTVSDSLGRQRSMTVYPTGDVDLSPAETGKPTPTADDSSRDETVADEEPGELHGPVREPSRITTTTATPSSDQPHIDRRSASRPVPSMDDTQDMPPVSDPVAGYAARAMGTDDGQHLAAPHAAQSFPDQDYADQFVEPLRDDDTYDELPTAPGRDRRVTRPARRTAGPHVPRISTGSGSWWHQHRTALGVIVAAVVVVVVGASVGLGAMFGHSTHQDAPQDPAVAMGTPADPASDAVECPTRTDGAVTTGRDPGDQTSGPNVIKAFEYAYFRWRSGAVARALATPDARIGAAADLQLGIDALNPAARYCTSITDKNNGAYQLALTLIYPNGSRDPKPSVQDITTTVLDGRTFITSLKQY